MHIDSKNFVSHERERERQREREREKERKREREKERSCVHLVFVQYSCISYECAVLCCAVCSACTRWPNTAVLLTHMGSHMDSNY